MIASVLTICGTIAIPLRVHAQAGTTATAQPAATTAGALAPASAMAAPNLECKLHARGSAPDSGITVFTDGDGYARFFAVRSAAAQVLTCANESKEISEYAVDLASESTFAERPLDIAKEPGIDRPPLAGDPLTISQAELSARWLWTAPGPRHSGIRKVARSSNQAGPHAVCEEA